jgi:hypothetical protein
LPHVVFEASIRVLSPTTVVITSSRVLRSARPPPPPPPHTPLSPAVGISLSFLPLFFCRIGVVRYFVAKILLVKRWSGFLPPPRSPVPPPIGSRGESLSYPLCPSNVCTDTAISVILTFKLQPSPRPQTYVFRAHRRTIIYGIVILAIPIIARGLYFRPSAVVPSASQCVIRCGSSLTPSPPLSRWRATCRRPRASSSTSRVSSCSPQGC